MASVLYGFRGFSYINYINYVKEDIYEYYRLWISRRHRM